MTEIASNTKRPPVMAKTISCFVIIPIAPKEPPKASEPVSPIKIFAGGALNHKNPIQAPIIEPQKTEASPIWRNVGTALLVGIVGYRSKPWDFKTFWNDWLAGVQKCL